ncbi:hypothetical protein BDV96DRAFT_666359 [Lophiotrema nucula]|uniref:Uncharacterized protein n=1 Tax=Lophiotrema nucula TaxID=690887 RepID=A0A6A5YW11_9PLEO|nr:hypothetical protein BDV96DRAFT_666359 [Lophiotrema nucula]
MDSIIERTEEIYLQEWSHSVYSNFAMLRHVLDHLHSESPSPWIELFMANEKQITHSKKTDTMTDWEKASHMMKQKKSLFKVYTALPSNITIPEKLWKHGNGLCTSFAIAVNEIAGTEAKYIDYKRQHRAAHRTLDNDAVLVIDSGALKAFEIADGETASKWENIGKGQVTWAQAKKYQYCDREAAMMACFAQLWSKATIGITFYREMINGKAEFGRMIQFSPRHKSYKLLDKGMDNLYNMQYVVFGDGNSTETPACYLRFLQYAMTGFEAADRFAVAEMVDVFATATELWGPPRFSKMHHVSQIHDWPTPAYL